MATKTQIKSLKRICWRIDKYAHPFMTEAKYFQLKNAAEILLKDIHAVHLKNVPNHDSRRYAKLDYFAFLKYHLKPYLETVLYTEEPRSFAKDLFLRKWETLIPILFSFLATVISVVALMAKS